MDRDQPTASEQAVETASAVMTALRELVPGIAYSLSAWDIGSGTRDHVRLIGDGYSPLLQEVVHANFIDDNPWFKALHHYPNQALRWVDIDRELGWDIRELQISQEYFCPEGFNEGAGLYLRTPDGRYTGMLSLNWTSERDATDEAKRTIEAFGPLLAQACDLLSDARRRLGSLAQANVVLVSDRGGVRAVEGYEAGPHLDIGGRLRATIDTETNHRSRRRYLWVDQDLRLCHRVEVIPCQLNARLIASTVIDWPFALTQRELEVLTLVTLGYTNPQIAERLWISARTVSTHVERILAKLDCHTRAEAAATAARADLQILGLVGVRL